MERLIFLAFLEIFRQYLLIQTTGSIGVVYIHIFTVAGPDLQIRWGGAVGSHPDSEIRERRS